MKYDGKSQKFRRNLLSPGTSEMLIRFDKTIQRDKNKTAIFREYPSLTTLFVSIIVALLSLSFNFHLVAIYAICMPLLLSLCVLEQFSYTLSLGSYYNQ